LSSSGLYTAPARITAQQTVQITARSVADSSRSATATVTLNPKSAGGIYSVSWTAISATQARVSWTAPIGHSTRDVIRLTGYGAVSWWYLWQGATTSATSGEAVVNLPTSPGIWQFRYINGTTNEVAAASANLPVGLAQFSVANSPASGGTSAVSFTAPAGRPTTWADIIGVYRVGSTNDKPVWRQYTMGATTGSFELPAISGIYELRYVAGYVATAASGPVTLN
jgi:hypothetical protein